MLLHLSIFAVDRASTCSPPLPACWSPSSPSSSTPPPASQSPAGWSQRRATSGTSGLARTGRTEKDLSLCSTLCLVSTTNLVGTNNIFSLLFLYSVWAVFGEGRLLARLRNVDIKIPADIRKYKKKFGLHVPLARLLHLLYIC